MLQVTAVVDNLAQQHGRSLPSQIISEIFLSFFIVELVFCLWMVYTSDCWERSSTDQGLTRECREQFRCITNLEGLTEEYSIYVFDLCGRKLTEG